MADYHVWIGPNLAIDSAGNIIRESMPPGYAVTPKRPFPVDLEKIEKTLEGIEKLFPDPTATGKDEIEKFQKFAAKLAKFGLAKELGDLLGYIGKAAGVLATAAAVIGGAVAVLDFIADAFGEKENPDTAKIMAGIDDLRQIMLVAMETQQVDDYDDWRSDMRDSLQAVRDRTGDLVRATTPEEVADAAGRQVDAVRALIKRCTELVGVQNHQTIFRREQYMIVNPFEHLLSFSPAGTPRTVEEQHQRDLQRTQNAFRFDTRLLHGVAAYGVTIIHLAIMRAFPEARSLALFTQQLKNLRDNHIDALIAEMESSALVRTLYTADNFRGRFPQSVVEMARFKRKDGEIENVGWRFRVLPPGAGDISDRYANTVGWPVGALDLSAASDAFFNQPAFKLGTPDDRRATFSFRWQPPASLVKITDDFSPKRGYFFEIANPEECAAAANAYAEACYADLLFGSPYFALVNASARLTYLISDPTTSETVRATVERLTRSFSIEPAAAMGPRIPMETSFEVRASAELRRSRVYVSGTTQRLPSAGRIKYRFSLRAFTFTSTEAQPGPDLKPIGGIPIWPADPGEWATSPEQMISVEREIEIRATTFDIYAPANITVKFKGEVDIDHTPNLWEIIKGMRGIDPPKEALLRTGRSEKAESDAEVDLGDIGWNPWQLTEGAFVTQAKARDVKARIRFYWERDRFVLRVEGRPEDRNYLLHLCIEEQLPREGRPPVLWTTFTVPIEGRVTFLPRDYYEKVGEAVGRASKKLLEMTTFIQNEKPDGPIPIEVVSGLEFNPQGLRNAWSTLLLRERDAVRTFMRRNR